MFLVKSLQRLSENWKDIISGFLVSPGSAETLVKWGGKIKYVVIAYFLGNIYRQTNKQTNNDDYITSLAEVTNFDPLTCDAYQI